MIHTDSHTDTNTYRCAHNATLLGELSAKAQADKKEEVAKLTTPPEDAHTGTHTGNTHSHPEGIQRDM